MHKIEAGTNGELSYRGWRLEIVPCGSQFEIEGLSSLICCCGSPTYIAFCPHEGSPSDWDRVWTRVGNVESAKLKAEYEGVTLARHIGRPSGIERAIDRWEESLQQCIKEAWEQYRDHEEEIQP